MTLADDKAFVERVLKTANEYGWNGDFIEVAYFVEWLYRQYGIEFSNDLLNPVE